MPVRKILPHTLVAALAAGALLASPAFARPADRFDSPTSSLAGTTSPQTQPAPRTWPAYPTPEAAPAKAVPAPQAGGDDDIWLVIGVGLAAAGIVAGGAAGVARRRVPA